MLLNDAAHAWNNEVRSKALNLGWMVWEQAVRNQRQHEPSLVLLRGDRLILAYLRTGRPRAMPSTERFAEIPGVEVYVWRPPDWTSVLVTLLGDGRPGDPDGTQR
ncbi:hypothetical protein ACFQ07_20055 [Actinomadura adrarensis]|uniref:Uncharacterized protein n=1 Tax=Actinomadura adrarensis TaxID=1819600 RepID=A0ABW3CJ37_9ACTN